MDGELKPVPAESVPPLYDIPLSQVNRVLYKDWDSKQEFVDELFKCWFRKSWIYFRALLNTKVNGQ